MALMTVTQAANNLINLVGSVEGIMVTFPATNADGSANTAAQTAAITEMVNALVQSGLFQLPTGATLAQIQAFAPALVGVMSNYKLATKKTEI